MNNLIGQFIILCWVIFLVYWIIAAFSVKRTAKGGGFRSWGWRFPIFAAVILAILFHRGRILSRFAVGTILWQRTIPIGIASDIISFTGLIVMIWARRVLGGNWSSDVVIKKDHELIERGPYEYVRHPIYSGLLLMVLGAAILSGRIIAFIVFAIFFLGFWFKSRQEELLLTRHFPEEYPKYQKHTKAFIPFIF